MNRSVVHDNNGAWEWIRIAKRKNFIFNEIFERLHCERPLQDFPCDETFHCICRKEGPSFRALEWPGYRRCNSNWRPTILSITCTPICGRFINENQLVCCPSCETLHHKFLSSGLYCAAHI